MNHEYDLKIRKIRNDWRQIMPSLTIVAHRSVNGEPSWVCPLCGNGSGENGDGITWNPKSKDGTGLKCFKCDFSGDIIDLYQQDRGVDFKTAIADLAQIAGLTIDNNRPHGGLQSGLRQRESIVDLKTPSRVLEMSSDAQAADYSSYYATCSECLNSAEGAEGLTYLNQRGVTGPAIYHGAGYDAKERRIIIPCSSGFYIARSIDAGNTARYKNPLGASIAIFNEAVLYAQDVQDVFITESAFDALSVIEVGGQAIGLNSTSNARKLIKKLEQRPTAATLILFLDNDAAGKSAAKTLREGFERLQLSFLQVDYSSDSKDPNEALIKNRSAFYDAVQDASAQARAIKEEQRLKAQRMQIERQQRTGASMVDDFLRSVRSEKYKPISTGITGIDRAIGGGFIRQQLVLLGAAPGAGKTALAQWIFEVIAQQGTACVYLNQEMSREQMLARSISRIAAQSGNIITATDVLQGYKWTDAQADAIIKAAEKYKAEIASQMIYNPDGITADLDSIMDYLESEAAQAEDAGMPAPLVVLDYLQIVHGRDREDDATVIKRAVGSLKGYAIKHNTVVFLIIAHNRAANQSGTVTLESGRDTSALEYSADLQLGLAFTRCLNRSGFDRKTKEQLTPEEMQFVTLKVTKARFGRQGVEVDLHFNGETMTYTQVDNHYDDLQPATKSGRLRV